VVVVRARMPADDTILALLVALLADAHDRAGHADRALALVDEVLATAARAKIVIGDVADWWNHRGDLRRRAGRCAEAIDDFHHAADVAERADGSKSQRIGAALRGEGTCLHDLGRDPEAIAALEKGLTYPIPPYAAEEAARAKALLAKLRP
jgi:tetratricopeptide (TPR) repeat protein